MLSVLAIAALVAGATGSWSPCGLSMIDTLGGRRAALALFSAGTLIGGVLVFGGLALAGDALGFGAWGVAAAIALGAALLELTGRPVTPQIRRQVPEPWRRVLPLPLAGLGYGVLLGMGFTTFVLSYAVPALAAIMVALGDPAAGLVVGLAFGAGRALPIAALGPIAETERGLTAMEAMAERPGLLRGARVGDGVALLAVAGALAASASAAVTARRATDPSADRGRLAWQVPGEQGRLRVGDVVQPLPAAHPAVGGGWVAVADGANVHVLRPGAVRSFPATGVSGLAVSAGWVAWRAGGRITAVSLRDGERREVRGPSLSRPALGGDRLVWSEASRRRSAIRALDLGSGRLRTLRTQPRALLSNPSIRGRSLAYVRATSHGQQLVVGRAARRRDTLGDRVLLSIGPLAGADSGHDPGRTTQGRGTEHSRRRSRWMLWTTALTDVSAYVTRFDPRRGRSSILRVGR